jgi:cholesterol transport system auxiliary component
MPLTRHKYISIPVVIIFLTLILAGCLNLKQPRNKIEYYTLEYEPPAVQKRPPVSSAVRIDRFAVSPIYDTNRIIYRDGSFKREAYVYYKWRANPGDVVTYFLRRDMQQSGLFKAVLTGESHLGSGFRLEGSVDEFLEWDKPNGWEALLSVSITLIQENEPDISKKILSQKTYTSTQPCREKIPIALAEAMSLAMSEISGQIMLDIYTVILSTGTR